MRKKEIPQDVEKITVLQACNIFMLSGRNRRIAEKLFLGKEFTENEWSLKFEEYKLIGGL